MYFSQIDEVRSIPVTFNLSLEDDHHIHFYAFAYNVKLIKVRFNQCVYVLRHQLCLIIFVTHIRNSTCQLFNTHCMSNT